MEKQKSAQIITALRTIVLLCFVLLLFSLQNVMQCNRSEDYCKTSYKVFNKSLFASSYKLSDISSLSAKTTSSTGKVLTSVILITKSGEQVETYIGYKWLMSTSLLEIFPLSINNQFKEYQKSNKNDFLYVDYPLFISGLLLIAAIAGALAIGSLLVKLFLMVVKTRF